MNDVTPTFYYQVRLREELMSRIDRNPRYSLRSFATALGLDPSDLSQIMAGKRSVSTKLVDRILNYLEFDLDQQKKFLESLLEEKKQKGLKRISPELKQKLKAISEAAPAKSIHGVGLNEFRVIADWYHYAILEMTFSKDFKPDPRWIGKQLNISPMEAKLAVERMLELELLEKQDGTFKKTNLNLDTKDKSKTSTFLRRRQKQILEKSIHSLEHDPIEVRNHSGLTFCIDPKNVPIAKTKIQNFMWELAQLLVTGTPERVYELNVSLFPLQNSNGENKNEK